MAFLNAYKSTRVMVTGDTGFKGSWLSWWLSSLGAEVTGLALPPEQEKGPYVSARLSDVIRHVDVDIRDPLRVEQIVSEAQPRVLFHLAAQPLVRESYRRPVDTVATNVLGTVHVMEAVRKLDQPCALVIVTSDKCYENTEVRYSYRETDRMGGHDIYSASKGCAELMVSAYRRSFFSGPAPRVLMASARAGNVIGPGDWAEDRIVPDAIRALLRNEPLKVRNPNAVRPWQHVLEPLSGYLWLGARLLSDDAAGYADAWNFGPQSQSARTVSDLADGIMRAWGSGAWVPDPSTDHPHEANYLDLSIEKAARVLNWVPVWDFDATVSRMVHGYHDLEPVIGRPDAVRQILSREIEAYTTDARRRQVEWAVKES